MKLWSWIALPLALLLASCATTTVRVITTDKGGSVTDTTTVSRGTDPAALRLLSVAAEVYLPRRAVVIRQEKSAAELRRILRGWQGRQAIAHAPGRP